MQNIETKEFNIKDLAGISKKNIEEHLKLYKGYVTNANYVLNKIKELNENKESNMYFLGELRRRFSFEFDGVRNHEIFFSLIENGYQEIPENSLLKNKIEKDYNSFENFISEIKSTAITRGTGWVMVYFDKITDNIFIQWVDEHHLGQLTGLSPIIAIDMWEHSFVYDYPTSEKKNYIEAILSNLDWQKIEKNFTDLLK
jgi:Fe-Mn family superoxide dismutase